MKDEEIDALRKVLYLDGTLSAPYADLLCAQAKLANRLAAEAVNEAAASLVDFMLDSAVPIGPFRSRADYPEPFRTLLTRLRAAEEGK